jgi:hypothetical protein
MPNSPTTSALYDIDKALDNLIDWMLGHDDEELANIDFRKAKREVLTTVESYGDRRELEGQLAVWKRLKGRQGLYMNAEGNLEINPEYIQERIDELESQKEKNNG